MSSLDDIRCGKCGHQKFLRLTTKAEGVDFSRDGAIPGAPFRNAMHVPWGKPSFVCQNCGTAVPASVAEEMEAMVL